MAEFESESVGARSSGSRLNRYASGVVAQAQIAAGGRPQPSSYDYFGNLAAAPQYPAAAGAAYSPMHMASYPRQLPQQPEVFQSMLAAHLQFASAVSTLVG
jgi:hypothetical protein